MRELYRQHLPLLRFIASKNTKRPQVQVLLPTLTRVQLKMIAEIAFNILKGVIPLPVNAKQILGKYIKSLRLLGQPDIPIKKIQKLLTVGVLQALLHVSMPYIDTLKAP